MLNQYDNPNSESSIARPLCRKRAFHALRCAIHVKLTTLLSIDPDAHYHTTALEIIASIASTPSTPARPSSGKVDLLVAGAGTGGTISGLSRRLRESNPDLLTLGVDPVGSILARPEALNEMGPGDSPIYKVEGTGYDFVSCTPCMPAACPSSAHFCNARPADSQSPRSLGNHSLDQDSRSTLVRDDASTHPH